MGGFLASIGKGKETKCTFVSNSVVVKEFKLFKFLSRDKEGKKHDSLFLVISFHHTSFLIGCIYCGGGRASWKCQLILLAIFYMLLT